MLTVGYVASIIALSITIISFLLPNVFALVLVALVGRQRNAATWSVVGRDVQRTFWPFVLRSDTISTSQAPRSVQILSWAKTFGVALVALAAFITPLGLKSGITVSSRPTNVAFGYVEDNGPFGRGTPARDPSTFYSRICYENGLPANCPFGNTDIDHTTSGSNFSASWNGSYDVRIPYTTAAMFTSHYADYPNTVAGIFDLQWRQYSYLTSPDFNNGDRYVVGLYKAMNSLLVDDTTQAVDGLIVNTRDGGIALRNHTAPKNMAYGAEWEEELMYITPETVCVDTNLTLEFQIAPLGYGLFDPYVSTSSGMSIVNLSLVDRGGFSNINRTYPEKPFFAGQSDAELQFRAYKAAWINNAWTMMFLNVTNPRTAKLAPFSYMNSTVGKKFPLDARQAASAGYGQIALSSRYGDYLPLQYSLLSSGNSSLLGNASFPSTQDPRSVYPNPFRVLRSNFSMASIECQGAGGQDLANISNLAIACGLMYGAATRVNIPEGTSGLVAEPGSWWSQPLYSCASGLKAEVKRVRFQWNSTLQSRGLSQALTVLSATEKTYDSPAQMPYWAVERPNATLSEISALWGPISKAMVGQHGDSFDFLQSEHLWIPGYAMSALPASVPTTDNMPADAFIGALGDAYGYAAGMSEMYSGRTSASIFARWQSLSSSAGTAASIPGLIWTDIIANAITTVRSTLSSNGLLSDTQPAPSEKRATEAAAPLVNGAQNAFAVYTYENRITYNWPFGIPIFLALLLVGGIVFAGIALLFLGQLPGPSTMSYFINHTSAGRLLALLAHGGSSGQTSPQSSSPYARDQKHPSDYVRASVGTGRDIPTSSLSMPSKDWQETVGRRMVNIDFLGAHEPDQRQSGVQYDPGAYHAGDRGRYEALSHAPRGSDVVS